MKVDRIIESVSESLAEYKEALRVIEWLQDNNLLDKSLKPAELAESYAITYSNYKDITTSVLQKAFEKCDQG